MRIQLINTPYLASYGRLKKIAPVYFPLGLGYIAAVLRENGFREIDLFDPEAERVNWQQIKERLKEFNADIVGISSVTATYRMAKQIAKLVKRIKPSVLVVMGGIHVSALPRETLLETPEIDLVVVGEGEYTMVDICQKGRKNFFSIPGIFYKSGQKIICTKPRSFIEDLDQIPYPARELVNPENYQPPSHMDIGEKSTSLISSRGCPGNCTFCASRIVAGRKFRAHSPEYVVGEIDYLERKYGFRHFIFEDDAFTIDRQRVEGICQLLLKRKKKILWSCFGRVNSVDKGLLKMMGKSGCYLVGFGIESGDERILKNIKKGISLSECREVFKLSREIGLKTQGFFMIGNPGETVESIKKTIKLAIELDPDYAFFSPLVPYPGTEIYQKYRELGLTPSLDWGNYSAFGDNLALRIPGFSSEKIRYFCSLANQKFYLRPTYLWRRIKNLSSFAEFKSSLKGAIGILAKSFEKI